MMASATGEIEAVGSKLSGALMLMLGVLETNQNVL